MVNAGDIAVFAFRGNYGYSIGMMSIYSKDAAINNGDLTQTEIHLYGSSRLGVYNLKNNMQRQESNAGTILTFTRGEKFFELSNHLGNVLATVSDKKLQYSSDNVTVDYFTADVVSAHDYYPFGMLMPGRKYSVANTNYRYGFNGKENDNAVKGEGNQQDYGMRIYDPRLGRFLSVDPITKEYPELTPFQFSSNNPVWNIDLDGLEGVRYTDPKQMLYEAGGDISEAMGNMADKFSAKVEAGYTYFKNLFTKKNTTVTLERKTTFSAGLSSNASNYLSYVKNNNSSEGAPSLFNFSFGRTQTISIVTKEQVGPVSVTNTSSLDSKGVSKDKNAATLSSTFAGIPTDFSINTSNNSLKENSFSIDLH